MRTAGIAGAGRLACVDRQDPEPAPAGVVVDVETCGLCATDAHALVAGGGRLAPGVFGHEWVGTLSAVGTEVDGFEPGQRVLAAVGSPCGACAECRRGRSENCELVQAEARARDAGAAQWGGYAERIPVSARRVMAMPEGIDRETAACLEPASVAYRGVRLAGVDVGDVVLVQGAGTIGLFALQWAKVAGARHVVVVEPTAERRSLALRLGADAAVPPDEAQAYVGDLTGGGVDLAVECTGVAPLLATAFGAVRRGGRLGLLGYPLVTAEVSVADWLVKEVTVRGSLGYSRRDIADTVAFAAAGRVSARGMTGRRVGFSELQEALVDVAEGRAGEPRIIFEPGIGRDRG